MHSSYKTIAFLVGLTQVWMAPLAGAGDTPLTTELLKSEQDWQALRHEWDGLLAGSVSPSVFMSFDYLHTAFRIFFNFLYEQASHRFN